MEGNIRDKNLVVGSNVIFKNQSNEGVVTNITILSTSSKRTVKYFTVFFNSGEHKNQAIKFMNDRELYEDTKHNFNKRTRLNEENVVTSSYNNEKNVSLKIAKPDCVLTNSSSIHTAGGYYL